MIAELFANERADFDGAHYRLSGAPLAPKPIQNPLPLMIGGTGQRRTIPTAVRYAHEWNGWCTPAEMRRYNALIDRLCRQAGRDPAGIQRSAAVMVSLSDSPVNRAERASRAGGRPWMAGSPNQITEQVAEYAAAGADELVIPDFNLRAGEAFETIERFAAEVAAPFKPQT